MILSRICAALALAGLAALADSPPRRISADRIGECLSRTLGPELVLKGAAGNGEFRITRRDRLVFNLTEEKPFSLSVTAADSTTEETTASASFSYSMKRITDAEVRATLSRALVDDPALVKSLFPDGIPPSYDAPGFEDAFIELIQKRPGAIDRRVRPLVKLLDAPTRVLIRSEEHAPVEITHCLKV
jgi:hypothetical protein